MTYGVCISVLYHTKRYDFQAIASSALAILLFLVVLVVVIVIVVVVVVVVVVVEVVVVVVVVVVRWELYRRAYSNKPPPYYPLAI